MVYWSFNSFSLLIADLTVTADVVLKDKRHKFRNVPVTADGCDGVGSADVDWVRSNNSNC